MKVILTISIVIVLLALNGFILYKTYEQKIAADAQNSKIAEDLQGTNNELTGLRARIYELEKDFLLQKDEQINLQDVKSEINSAMEQIKSRQQQYSSSLLNLEDRIKTLQEKKLQADDDTWRQEVQKLKQQIELLEQRMESIFKSPKPPSPAAKQD